MNIFFFLIGIAMMVFGVISSGLKFADMIQANTHKELRNAFLCFVYFVFTMCIGLGISTYWITA